MKSLSAILVLVVAMLGSGCQRNEPAASTKPVIATTLLPVHCLAANVAGDHAEVISLLGSAADAHDFQLTPRERRLLDRANLVVANGLGLEPWLSRVVAGPKKDSRVVVLSAGFEAELIHSSHPEADSGHVHSSHRHDHSSEGINPHIWLDPHLYRRMVTNFLSAIQTIDPANATAYASNATVYLARLERLDLELQSGLAPLTNSPIVTYHDAFPYLARRYGLRVVGVVEETPHVSPTPKHLSELRNVIEKERVKVLFTEPQQPDKLARRLAEDLKLRMLPLDTLETGEFTPSAYEDGMRKNLQSLREALR